MPFMSYLQSLINMENDPKYIKSRYDIYFLYYKKGEPEEQRIHLAGFYVFNGGKTFYHYEGGFYHYEIFGFAPKEYFKIKLHVCHYYKPIKIIKELGYYPLNAYKIINVLCVWMIYLIFSIILVLTFVFAINVMIKEDLKIALIVERR